MMTVGSGYAVRRTMERPRRSSVRASDAVASSGGTAHPAISPLGSVVDPGFVAMDPTGKRRHEGADHEMKNIIPTLAVADIDASVRFYAEVLGIDVAFTLPGEDGKLIHASVQRGDSSLMFGRIDPSNPHDQDPRGRGVILYATVADNEDIDTYFQRVKDAGATVVQEPTDQFWGHRDWGITDPDGYLLFISKETQAVSADAMREAALAGSPA